MIEKRRRSSSVYYIGSARKSKNSGLHYKVIISGKQLTIGIIIGVCLTIITIILQCVAFATPHWKEVTPNKHSLYVDGVDALIRTEILVYFNFVHRFTRQSYGLFQRCEYPMHNSSKVTSGYDETSSNIFNYEYQKCTKNFLPSYEDDQFNTCHSLQYYRFCSKASEKHFDISNVYIRSTFDSPSDSHSRTESKPSCNCQYPTYIKVCHVLSLFILIFLSLTVVLFAVFPFVKARRRQLKVKCFAVISSLFSAAFILFNLLVISHHLNYETIEYLVAIEKHYRSSQIYKLSQDAKLSIDRFLSNVTIEIGYSTIISWVVFFLSIIDGLLLMLTCRITGYHEVMDPDTFTAVPMDTPTLTIKSDHDEYKTITTPLATPPNETDSQTVHSPPPLSPNPTIIVTNTDEQLKEHRSSLVSPSKHSYLARVNFEHEV